MYIIYVCVCIRLFVYRMLFLLLFSVESALAKRGSNNCGCSRGHMDHVANRCVLEYDVSFSLGKTILIESYDCYKRNKLMILCLPKLAVLFPLNHLGMIVGGCCWAGFKKAHGGSHCGHPQSYTHTHPRTHTRTDCERTQGVELKRDEAWSNRVLPRLMADGALCQEDATAKVESNLGICMDAVGCMLVC